MDTEIVRVLARIVCIVGFALPRMAGSAGPARRLTRPHIYGAAGRKGVERTLLEQDIQHPFADGAWADGWNADQAVIARVGRSRRLAETQGRPQRGVVTAVTPASAAHTYVNFELCRHTKVSAALSSINDVALESRSSSRKMLVSKGRSSRFLSNTSATP